MAHSNSSINTFIACQRKYWHTYINNTKPCKPPSEHLRFGAMAHEVLENAGKLRDDIADGVRDLSATDYMPVIPSELMYNDLKQFFGISKWYTYFMPIINQVYEYEQKFVKELSNNGQVTIERELKLQMTSNDLANTKFYIPWTMLKPLVGVIDLLIRTDKEAVIIDYKFSTTRKDQRNYDIDSQLYIYALLVSYTYNIPLSEIRVGYIDIPKQECAVPTVLSNGKLSRAKSQNILPELYKAAVKAIHGDDNYYNCEKGGYYYDCYCSLQLVKSAYLSYQYVDMLAYNDIVQDILYAIGVIDGITLKYNKSSYLCRFDSYSCKDCEYLNSCKPWIYRTGVEE